MTTYGHFASASGSILRVTIAAVVVMWLTSNMVAVTVSAQDDDITSTDSQSIQDDEDGQTEAQPEQSMQTTDKNADEDFAPNNGEEQPPVTNLETGLPLTFFLTPLHLGSNLSLLSASVSEGYNSNPSFERVPLGSWITAVSGVALYSNRFAGWRVNAQYQPFIWFSSSRTIQSFAAASGDIRTLHHLNDSWIWTVADRVRYSPSHGSEEQGLSLGGFSIGNAFLSTGRNVFVNAASATLTRRYSQAATLTFHANQDYTSVSSYLGSGFSDFPSQSATTIAAGATWRDRLDLKDTFSLEYTFRHQTASGTSLFDVNSQIIGIGLSHKFTETFGVSATAGPAFTSYTGENGDGNGGGNRATVHGSLAVAKEFHHGGIVASFARSDSFTGIISDSFHNRFDFSIHEQVTTRFHCSAVASYVQQEVSNALSTSGELAGVEGRYFLTPNWALFGQGRYISIGGNQRNFAPEKNVIFGIRWAWAPDKE